MQFNIIAIGKCKDKSINSLCSEYIKRLSPDAKVSVLELPHGKGELTKKQEAEYILSKIGSSSFIVALDERGRDFSSKELASFLESKIISGFSSFDFIIGGAEGLHDSVKTRANVILRLSKLTFPHMMARLILLEQLYRSVSINNNHPYHKD